LYRVSYRVCRLNCRSVGNGIRERSAEFKYIFLPRWVSIAPKPSLVCGKLTGSSLFHSQQDAGRVFRSWVSRSHIRDQRRLQVFEKSNVSDVILEQLPQPRGCHLEGQFWPDEILTRFWALQRSKVCLIASIVSLWPIQENLSVLISRSVAIKSRRDVGVFKESKF
jgi:hypothetical protein